VRFAIFQSAGFWTLYASIAGQRIEELRALLKNCEEEVHHRVSGQPDTAPEDSIARLRRTHGFISYLDSGFNPTLIITWNAAMLASGGAGSWAVDQLK
jgi:hypothetical protein